MTAKSIISLAFLTVLSCSMSPEAPITVYLIGDSTIANKETRAFPETGWGMPFTYFFDEGVKVENRAKNGRSTKSFLAENLWQPILNDLKAGDYVFIQFGHNDEAVEKKERYAPPDLYKTNLERYVSETRSKGAQPILITPVSRRKFDTNGKVFQNSSDPVQK